MKKPVKYIFVENVKGFEDSHTRDQFVEFLNRNGYIYQEFLLTPLQFGIPNSRLRYYCMARHKQTCGDFKFSVKDQVRILPCTCIIFMLAKTFPYCLYCPNAMYLTTCFLGSCLLDIMYSSGCH